MPKSKKLLFQTELEKNSFLIIYDNEKTLSNNFIDFPNYKRIMKYYYKHKKFDDYLDNIYNFKQIWQKKCSKYNIDSQPFILPKVNRIIVIGDIHGDWNMLIESLKVAELINNDNIWIGNNTVVVQVGDQIDRCRYSGIPCNFKEATDPDEGNDWKILQYMTNLHNQAQQVGGAVYSLLGNHELMNVQQNISYVSYEGLREFDNFIKPDGNIIKNGEEARLWAFNRGNYISEFLACTRPVALIIGSNLFVHAGILPNIAKKYSVNNINKLMTLYLLNELPDINKYKDILSANHNSPLWNRIFGNLNTNNTDINICNKLLQPLEKIYNVNKIYVGHTPMLTTGINSMCDNKIWLTDTGLSTAFNKFDNNSRSEIRQAQVLELLDDGNIINILK